MAEDNKNFEDFETSQNLQALAILSHENRATKRNLAAAESSTCIRLPVHLCEPNSLIPVSAGSDFFRCRTTTRLHFADLLVLS